MDSTEKAKVDIRAAFTADDCDDDQDFLVATSEPTIEIKPLTAEEK